MESYNELYRLGFISFLLSTSFISLVISYFVDAIATSVAFQLVYGSTLTLQNVIRLTLIYLIVYLLVEFTLWIFKELGYILNLKWVSWSLILQNLAWIIISLGDIGVRIIVYMNNIFLAPFIIYLITFLLYKVIKNIRKDFDPKQSTIFPDNFEPFIAIISSFIALLLKGILFYIL